MPRFFMPANDGPAGESEYQALRQQTEMQMGRPPSRRRIMAMWSRRGNLDCVTAVGAPDPVRGGIVWAIFDMGFHKPYVVYSQNVADPMSQTCDVLDCNAYSVTEFAA